MCQALPETTVEHESQQAAFRVGKKVFAYFLDNHHGDGIISVCIKTDKAAAAKLVRRDPDRFHRPAYIGAHGWLGVRLDHPDVDWKDVARRVLASWEAVAPSKLRARLPVVGKDRTAPRKRQVGASPR